LLCLIYCLIVTLRILGLLVSSLRTSIIITVRNYIIYLRLYTILCCRYWDSFVAIWIVIFLLFLVIRFSYHLWSISSPKSCTCTHWLVWKKSIRKTTISSLIMICLLDILRIVYITRNCWTDIFSILNGLFLII
jgi:hypothetical protein